MKELKHFCKICGRKCFKGDKKALLGMCSKHYSQFNKYGKILDTNPRRNSDPNEIVIYDTYAEIILYDRNNIENSRTKIDLDMVDKCNNIKWSLRDGGYCENKKEGRLHRFIMDCPDEMFIDHINGDRLDNRKENLRICTIQQNSMNQCVRKNNTSGVKGVTWDKSRNKWRAQIKINYKVIPLGRFDNKEDAIKARIEAEEKYFGEFNRK